MKFVAKILSVGVLLAAPFASADTLYTVGAGTFGTAVAGATISGTAATSFSTVPNPFVAKYTETVYRGGSNALVYCATCLNFVYSFSNTSTGSDPIDISSMTSYGSFLSTEGYVTGTGVAPGSVDRNGVNVSFSFVANGGVNAGQSSDQLVVFTNATNYGNGFVLFQDGTQAAGAAYVPAAPAVTGTPEPSSLALLGTGIASLGGLVRRRIKRA